MPILGDLSINIIPQNVYRYQGIPATVTPEKKIVDLYEKSVEITMQLSKPVAIWQRFKIASLNQKGLTFGKEYCFETCLFYRRFNQGSEIFLAVMTIGNDIEDYITSLFDKKEYALALFLDSAASEAIESVAREFEEKIRIMAAGESKFISPRVSPGYADWKIEDQRLIFDLLEPLEIGVTLLDSYTMMPRKSISLAILIGNERYRFNSNNACRNCSLDCQFRKV
ncbi:MAG: hypothetical protein JXA60_02845 [Candidatus Coatesbacteria bacterium]|nr:hypothetical protein [Candidatus Coatesbacteria bacterium]